MTNHSVLYKQAQTKLATLPNGMFRLADIIDNPPAHLGVRFRHDIVVKKLYSNIKRSGVDTQSIIYEKF
jgi:hypothetical protein